MVVVYCQDLAELQWNIFVRLNADAIGILPGVSVILYMFKEDGVHV